MKPNRNFLTEKTPQSLLQAKGIRCVLRGLRVVSFLFLLMVSHGCGELFKDLPTGGMPQPPKQIADVTEIRVMPNPVTNGSYVAIKCSIRDTLTQGFKFRWHSDGKWFADTVTTSNTLQLFIQTDLDTLKGYVTVDHDSLDGLRPTHFFRIFVLNP